MKKLLYSACILLIVILSACNYEPASSVLTVVESTESVTTKSTEDTAAAYQISDFECVYQMPELPTGCEITAMEMVLQYYGFDIDKVTMANDYMPTISYDTRWNDESVTDKNDMNNYFIGDPETVYGYIAGTGAIQIAANDYLEDENSDLEAYDITGASFSQLYNYIDNNIPVVIWVTIGMIDRSDVQYYYIDSDTYIEWTMDDHGAVLIGYDDTTVTIADPISGIVEYDREQFESVFASRGNMAVVVE